MYQFKDFERKGIPYIAVDYFGFGEERPFPTNYTLEQLTDYIVNLLRKNGIKSVIPIGDSMGGYIMFDMWRRYRDIIRGFVFVSTRAEADSEEAKQGRYALIERIKKEGKDFLIDIMLDIQTSPATKENKEKMETLKCIMKEATEDGIIKALNAMAGRKDSTDILPTINVPTLVIAGEDDEKVTPPEVVKKIADGIPSAKFLVIPKSAHLPPFENHTEFNNIVIPFVEELI
jgi:3-oxoadipate enol-lactonase